MKERNETNLVLLAMNIIMKKNKYFKHSYLYNHPTNKRVQRQHLSLNKSF